MSHFLIIQQHIWVKKVFPVCSLQKINKNMLDLSDYMYIAQNTDFILEFQYLSKKVKLISHIE